MPRQYLRFIYLREFKSAAERACLHIFSSFLYKKLQLAKRAAGGDRRTAYSALRRWTAGVALFQTRFAMVPVCLALHWSLAVLCELPALHAFLEREHERLLAEARAAAAARAAAIVVDDDDDAMDGGGSARDVAAPAAAGTAVQSAASPVALAAAEPAPAAPASEAESEDIPIATLVAAATPTGTRRLRPRASTPGVASAPPDHRAAAGEAAPDEDDDCVLVSSHAAPSAAAADMAQPMIVFLDSLGYHNAKAIAAELRAYLLHEWEDKHNGGYALGTDKDSPSPPKSGRGRRAYEIPEEALPLVQPACPAQDNSCDCGVFVLKYAARWRLIIASLLKGRKFLTQRDAGNKLSAFFRKETFSKFHVVALRILLQRLMELLRRDRSVLIALSLPDCTDEADPRSRESCPESDGALAALVGLESQSNDEASAVAPGRRSTRSSTGVRVSPPPPPASLSAPPALSARKAPQRVPSVPELEASRVYGVPPDVIVPRRQKRPEEGASAAGHPSADFQASLTHSLSHHLPAALAAIAATALPVADLPPAPAVVKDMAAHLSYRTAARKAGLSVLGIPGLVPAPKLKNVVEKAIDRQAAAGGSASGGDDDAPAGGAGKRKRDF